MKPEQSDQETPQSNFDRLRSHLKEGCLAQKLVFARTGAEGLDAWSALRKVVTDRIVELKREYDLPDQKA